MRRLPAQLGSHVSSVWGFVRWGKGEENENRKTRRLKSTITHFLSFTTSIVKPILTRAVKTTRSGNITTQGHFVFLITSPLGVFFSTCTFPEKLHLIPNMDLSLFTRMCFPEVLCALWTITYYITKQNQSWKRMLRLCYLY